MRTNHRRHLTFANVIALIALFVALGGGAYAAMKVKPNSVGTKQLKNNAVNSDKVKDGSLSKGDFANGQLPAGKTGPQGPQGPAGPVDIVYVTKTVNQPVNSQSGGSVNCPAGLSVTGGGANVGGLLGHDLNASFPVDGPDADTLPNDAWRVTVNNETASASNTSITAACTSATSTSTTPSS
jgi:hypothetical protein